jgi:hypothetical protein
MPSTPPRARRPSPSTTRSPATSTAARDPLGSLPEHVTPTAHDVEPRTRVAMKINALSPSSPCAANPACCCSNCGHVPAVKPRPCPRPRRRLDPERSSAVAWALRHSSKPPSSSP